MPKIAAPTVAEHRSNVQRRLVDAAEEILLNGHREQLTAGAVTSAAGIARNSIYRYVESVDDLVGLVLARHLPAWLDAVEARLAEANGPADRVVALVSANLEQASRNGHSWMQDLGGGTPTGQAKEVMERAHSVIRTALSDALRDLTADPVLARAAAGLIRGVMESGFKQLEVGLAADVVERVATAAVRGILADLAQ